MNLFSDYLNPNNPKYDPYLPAQVNLNLQQFDNYCIYEIAGITYYSNINQTVVEIDSFVAYQRFDITPVTVDFRALVDKYHDFGIVKSGKFWNLFALIGYQHTYERYVTSNGIVVEPRSPVFAQGSYYPPTTISIGDSKFDNQVLIDYAWNNKSNFPITTNSYYKNTPDGINRDVSSPYIFDTSLAKTNAQIITTGAPLNLAKQITLSTLNNKAGIPYKFAATFFFLWQPQAINLKPNYSDLITGYARDSRKIPTKLTITAFSNIILDIKHYRKNPYESIPRLTSLDWVNEKIELKANIPFDYDCTGIVLGTLQLIPNIVTPVNCQVYVDNGIPYPYSYLLNNIGVLDIVFNYWNSLLTANIGIGRQLIFPADDIDLSLTKLKILAATHDYWNNNLLPITSDVGTELNHPFFAPVNSTIIKQHLSPQIEGIGTLAMDSIRVINTDAAVKKLMIALNALEYQLETPAVIGTGTIDNPETPANHKLDWYIKNSAGGKVTAIWKALGGDKYGTNELDSSEAKVNNLGFLVERIAKVLGIRFDDNGSIDPVKEKKLVRQVVPSKKPLDPKKIGVNCFGDEGMVIKRINNRFDKDKIESDQCVIVQDLFQLIQEYHDQDNLAFGIQESSAIEIKDGKNIARFDNQLGLSIEMFNLLSSANEMTRANLVSCLVAQSQTSEIIAGLGLPSVTKTIPVKIDKKFSELPYKGIAPHRSISQQVATCTANVGIVLGQLL